MGNSQVKKAYGSRKQVRISWKPEVGRRVSLKGRTREHLGWWKYSVSWFGWLFCETTRDWHLKWILFYIRIEISVLRLFHLLGSWRVKIGASAHGYISYTMAPVQLNAECPLENPRNSSYTLACIVSLPLFHPNKGRDHPEHELVIKLPSKVLVRKSYPQKYKHPQLSTSLCHI